MLNKNTEISEHFLRVISRFFNSLAEKGNNELFSKQILHHIYKVIKLLTLSCQLLNLLFYILCDRPLIFLLNVITLFQLLELVSLSLQYFEQIMIPSLSIV